MQKISIYTLLMFLFAGTISTTLSRIIRVPQDEVTISRALNAARALDTVMVADGVYDGNGNVDLDIDNRIILISENGPEDCIIDGQNDIRNAFTLGHRSVLSGFTIRRTTRSPLIIDNVDDWRVSNCIISDISSESDSVGSLITRSEGIFEYCVFRNLSGIKSGAALFISSSDVVFNYCYFINNTADSMGGAFHIRQSSDVEFTNCLFDRNESRFVHGGAIAMFGSGTDVIINFCNFIDNEASNWGGAIYKDQNSRPIIANSIFWGNEAGVGNQLAAQLGNDNRLIRIINSIVEGGEDVEAGWFGDDLVEEAPRFARGRSPIWGLSSLYLHEDSPGIDQGSDSAEDLGMDNTTTQISLEPDEGTVDIGYHYDLDFYYALGQLTGYVYDIENDNPLDGARVVSSLGQESLTNRSGRWIMNEALADTTHSLTASYPGYNDSTVFDIELEENGNIETRFSLYHPEFSIDPLRIISNADLGDTGFVDITIGNSGNGPLEWSSKVALAGRRREPWLFDRSFNVGAAVDDNRIQGVGFVDGHYYVTGAAGDEPNAIYKFNAEGEIMDTFPQFGQSRNGMNGLTYDGELLWGTEDDTVFGFTPDGDLVTKWEQTLERGTAKYVAWDSDREILWQGALTSDLTAADREGNVAIEEEFDPGDLRVYGLAYYRDDPDGYPLYLITKRASGDVTALIYKFNPDTYDMIFAHTISPPVGKPSTGFVSYDIDPYSVYFLCIVDANNEAGGDKINVFFLAENSSWMMLDNTEGVVNPDEETVLHMTLFSERFGYGQFNGILTVFHNAARGEIEIPIILNILNVPVNKESYIPRTTEIVSVHPNPFNSMVTINFLVSDHNPVSWTVFDTAGRVVHKVSRMKYGRGLNQLALDATDWGSSVYFIQLSTISNTHTMKLVCLK